MGQWGKLNEFNRLLYIVPEFALGRLGQLPHCPNALPIP